MGKILELLLKFDIVFYMGVCTEMAFSGSYKNMDGLFKWLFPNKKTSPWVKIMDLIIITGIFTIIGVILLEPTNEKQSLTLGLSDRIVIGGIIERLRKGGKEDDQARIVGAN